MTTRRTRSGMMALVAVALATMIAGGPVAADTGRRHTGNNGPHFLQDSEEFPGARCRYDDSGNLHAIKVIDPIVFAQDINDEGVSVQPVAWQFMVQKRVGSGPWTNVKRSARQAAMARDDRPADFSPLVVTLSHDPAAIYRMRVKMLWFYDEKAVTLAGTAAHDVDWYRYPLAAANEGFCPAFVL